jgi:tetratricopeptide (TPR) repeat protein
MSERSRIALLLFVATLVYGNTLFNSFTLDDQAYVVHNPAVTNPSIRNLFEAHKQTNVFRPVTFATFALNWALGHSNTTGYHILNLLLHATVTLLLYLVLKKLLESVPRASTAAWTAALLFAVHPIHTEAVTSIVGRSELLAAGFLLAAWLFHLQDRPVLTLICFALALLSKESAVAFLLLALAGDYACGKLKPLHRYIWIVVLTVLYIALLWKVQGGRFGHPEIDFTNNPLAKLPADLRILNALRVAWKYVGLQIYPARLSCDYSYNAIPLYASWRHLAPAAVATSLVLALWFWALWTKRKEWFLAGAIYIAGFAVTANILLPIGTIMGERLAYLPSAGFCLLIALLCTRMEMHQPKLGQPLLALIIVALASRTFLRNRDWRDNSTLFFADVRSVPESVRIHDSIIGEYLARGQWDAAVKETQTTLRLYPIFPERLKAAGIAEYDFRLVMLAEELMSHGENDDALEFLKEAIADSPHFSLAWSNRAVIRYKTGEVVSARADAENALRLDPSNTQAQNVLASLNAGLVPRN